MDVLRVREEGLVLLAVGAGAHSQGHAPARELVQGRHLLGRDDHVAHREHQDARAEPEPRRARGHVGEGDERLVEVGRVGELALHVALGAHVVVAPHGIVAEPLAEERGGQDVRGPREGDRVHHALDAGGDVHAEAQRHRISFQAGDSSRPMRVTCSTKSTPGRPSAGACHDTPRASRPAPRPPPSRP